MMNATAGSSNTDRHVASKAVDDTKTADANHAYASTGIMQKRPSLNALNHSSSSNTINKNATTATRSGSSSSSSSSSHVLNFSKPVTLAAQDQPAEVKGGIVTPIQSPRKEKLDEYILREDNTTAAPGPTTPPKTPTQSASIWGLTVLSRLNSMARSSSPSSSSATDECFVTAVESDQETLNDEEDKNSTDTEIAPASSSSAPAPQGEVNRISMEVEKILHRARQQLVDMDQYLSRVDTRQQHANRPQRRPVRDSGIQHSDEDEHVLQRTVTNTTTTTTTTGSQESSPNNATASNWPDTTARGPAANEEYDQEVADETAQRAANRVSIAPSLYNRNSILYSPVIGKATQVELEPATSIHGTVTESDTSNSSVHGNSNASSEQIRRRTVPLDKIRQSTHELSFLLNEIQTLRRSTSERQQLQQEQAPLSPPPSRPYSNGKGLRERPQEPSSPEDFSSSSFEKRFTPPQYKTRNAPSTHPALPQQLSQQRPPTPPATNMGQDKPPGFEGVTAWKRQTPHNDDDDDDDDSGHYKKALDYQPTTVTMSRNDEPLTRSNTNNTGSDSSDEDLDGLMSSLDGYRNRLRTLNEQQKQKPQQQPSQPSSSSQSQSQPPQDDHDHSSPFGKQIGVPPSRPPPPTPPTIPPVIQPQSQSQPQQQTSFKDEMDNLLEMPNPPFKVTKRVSQDSSAESFITAQSPDSDSMGEEFEQFGTGKTNLLPSVLNENLSHDYSVPSDENFTAVLDEANRSKESYDYDTDIGNKHKTESKRVPSNSTSFTTPLVVRKSFASGETSSSPILGPLQDTNTMADRAMGGAGGASTSSSSLPQETQSKRNSSTRPVSSFRQRSEGSESTARNWELDRSGSGRSKSTVQPQEMPPVEPTIHEEEPKQKEEDERRKDGSERKKGHEEPRQHKKKQRRPKEKEGGRDKEHRRKHQHQHQHQHQYQHGREEKRPFSQPNVERLMDMADDSFKLEELDLPVDERHMMEKFIDALSKLSVEINRDERKRDEGKRRLQNALRAIEGWI